MILPLPAFLLVANTMLWTGAVEAIVTRDDDSLRLEHGFAWVMWPTRVHLHDAHFVIDGDSYQLDVELDEALVDISLLSLFDRHANLQSIDGTGVRAQYRVKIDPEDEGNPALAAFPPFDGTPPQQRKPPTLPAEGEAWTVDLHEVDLQVDALWIDEFAFEPVGTVQGGLHWVDGGAFSVPTTTVQTDGAGLWLGPHEAARGLTGAGSITIAEVDLGDEEASLTGALSFDYRGEGVIVEPHGLAIWWPEVAGIVAGDPGPIEIDASVENGVLTPGSRVHHYTPRADVGLASAMMRSAADLVLAVAPDGRPTATVTLTDAALRGDDVTMAHTKEVRGEVSIQHGELTRPWALERVHVETDEVVAEDLRALSRLAPPDSWTFERGSATGHARLDIGADEIPIAHVDAALEKAVFAVGSVTLGATMTTSGRIRYEGGEFVADQLTARTGALSVRTDEGKSDGTWVRLRGTSMRYADGELRLDSHLQVEDAKPAAIHLTRLDPMIEALPDLKRIEPISVHAKMLVTDDLFEVEVVDSEQLGLHVATVYRQRGEQWRLAVHASGLTAFGFTMSDDQKVGRPFVLVAKNWYADQRKWVRALGKRREG